MSDLEPSHYSTIVQPSTAELKIKGSRFIAYATPVEEQSGGEQILGRLRRTYHDATHVCYAYRIGIGEQAVYHYSDAGEPAGTAGAPIYQVISGLELTNLVVVVVRYFGGTKLGTGGLIRAYSAVTKEVLQSASVVRREIMAELQFQIGYDFLNVVLRELSAVGAQILAQNYGEQIHFHISVAKPRWLRLQEKLVNQTAGKIQFFNVDSKTR